MGKNKFSQIKITANIFFRKNLLQSKYSLLNSLHKKYSTKKSCVFNYNVRLLFRDKTVYNELLV